MKITIVGSGYVGLTTAAVFADSGADVIALDVDQDKVDLINNGRSHLNWGQVISESLLR
jgi:UDPglucose 6-dehydrogenase